MNMRYSSHRCRLTEEQRLKIIKLVDTHEYLIGDIAKRFGTTYRTIGDICRREKKLLEERK